MSKFNRFSCISFSSWGIIFIFFLLSSLVCEARILVPTINASLSGFVTTKDTQFLLNGSPFWFNGFNSYWMMSVAVEPTERHKISDAFREAYAAGLTLCRIWAFNDGVYRPLQISPGLYDENVFQALDFVISEARKYGIRLILSLVNNWKDYGGKPQYVQWARNAGVQITNDDDFYTNTEVKGYYKNHIKTVLTRFNTVTKITYKDDPTIMSWELINEPQCQTDYSGKTIEVWVQEMATYTKSIDNKHLLEIGFEGFYGDSMPEKKKMNPGGSAFGTDFISTNLIKEIDFATIHAYPDLWFPKESEAAQLEFMLGWMSSHWKDAREILKKPLVLTEFGKSNKDPGYTLTGRNSYMNEVYTSIYNLAKNGGTMGGGMVWHIVAEGMDLADDTFAIVLSQNQSTTRLITEHSKKMATLLRSK